MIDTSTKTPLRVWPGGTAGPYIIVPMTQLDELRQVLDKHGLRYWVDEFSIELNGAPATTFVNMKRGVEVTSLQMILDNVR